MDVLPRLTCAIIYHWMICIRLYTLSISPLLLQYVLLIMFVIAVNVNYVIKACKINIAFYE